MKVDFLQFLVSLNERNWMNDATITISTLEWNISMIFPPTTPEKHKISNVCEYYFCTSKSFVLKSSFDKIENRENSRQT